MPVAKEKNNIMSLLKIMACVSVFVGHYCSFVRTTDFILKLRYGNGMARTFLTWFTQGDFGNIVFFVCSGFLISYFFVDRDTINRTIKYIIKLLVPTIGIILITAFAFFVLSFIGDKSFIYEKLRKDLANVLFGGTIYYGTQLWYINTQIRGFIVCMLLQYVVKDKKTRTRYMFYITSTALLLYIREYYFFCIAVGLIFGNLARDMYETTKNKAIRWCAIVVLFPLVPYIFSFYCNHWDDTFFSWGYIVVATFFGLLLSMGVSVLKGKHKVIDIISSYTFSVYLVHMLVFNVYVKFRNFANVMINGVLEFVLVLVATVVAAFIYEKLSKNAVNKIIKVL